MTRAECQPRTSGMLSPKDQIIAQELFDKINNSGFSTIEFRLHSLRATVLNKGKRNSSMELLKDGITLKLRKGRRFWQDDGSDGGADIFFKDPSKEVSPWHPTVEARDNALRRIHDVLVKGRYWL